MSTNTYQPHSQVQLQKMSMNMLRQTVFHDTTTQIGKSGSIQIAKSQCLNSQNQITMLLQAIDKFNTQIADKERYYTKIANDIAIKLENKGQENKKIKAQIYQLKAQAKKIKKQCEEIRNGGNQKLQKCYSARDLVMSAKTQNSLEHCKSSANIYRMTLPSRQQMF